MPYKQDSESYIAVLTLIYIAYEFSLMEFQTSNYDKIIYHLILKDTSFFFQTLHTCFDSYKE
jgi:hypothetical protein